MKMPHAVRVTAAGLIGQRAAAMGYPREPPQEENSEEANAWLQAYDRALNCQRAGRDLLGHPPNIPRLCARDVRAVCNCCDRCREQCTAPKYPPSLITRILRKVLS